MYAGLLKRLLVITSNMHIALLKSCTRVENVTRLSQRVKDKSTMENLLINIHICENTLSGLYQMNTILPSLFLLCTMHASQKSFAQAYQCSHTGTLPYCHWKQRHTSRPVNGLSHMLCPTLIVSEVANQQGRLKRKHGVQTPPHQPQGNG